MRLTIIKKNFSLFLLLCLFLITPHHQTLFAAFDDPGAEAIGTPTLSTTDVTSAPTDESELTSDTELAESADADFDFSFDDTPTPEDQMPTEEPTKDEPMRFKLPIPYFDVILFEGGTDINTGSFKFTGYPSKKELDLGLLKIKNPNFTFSMDAGLQMSATVTFLEQELTTIKLEKFEFNQRVVLSIALPLPLKIPISLTRSLSFKKLFIELTKTEYSIYTTTSLTEKQSDIIKLELGLEKIPPVFPAIKPTLRPFIDLSFTNLALSAFVDNLANTPADKIVLKTGTGRITDPFKPSVEHIITLSGAIDFGDLSIPPLKLDNLTYAATIKTKTGFSLETSLGASLPLIPGLLALQNPKIAISNLPPIAPVGVLGMLIPAPTKKSTPFSFMLHGTINLNIPTVGKISTTLTADVKEGKLDLFEGILNRPINFMNLVKIENTKVRYSVTKDLMGKIKKEFEVAGDTHVQVADLDYDVIAHLKIDKKDAKTTVTFEGELKTQKPLKPFAKIPGIEAMPALKNLTLVNLGVGLDTKKTFFIQGYGSILDTNCKIKVIVTPQGLAIKGEPLEETALVKIIPPIKGSPLESFYIPKFALIASMFDFQDPDTGMLLPKGFSIQSSVDSTSKNFDMVRFLLKDAPPSLFLSATAGTGSASFAFMIPTEVSIPDEKGKPILTLEQVYLLLNFKPPSLEFAAKTRIKTRLPQQEEDTYFTGEIAIAPIPTPTVTLKGTMQGPWENAFGQKGVDLRDVALEFGASILIPPVPPFIRPSGFGFTGRLILSDKKEIAMATKISDKGDFVAMGEFKGELSSNDILFIPLNKGGAQIPLDAIPALTIKNALVKIAPFDTKIGEIPFSQGLTLKGELIMSSFGPINFSGARGFVDVTIDLMGIKMTGGLSTFKFGDFFELSGAGLDQKYGTTDDALIIDLALTPADQHFFSSGKMKFALDDKKLFDAETETTIKISPQIAYFQTHQQIAKIFKMKIIGTSSGSSKTKNLDFTITGEYNGMQSLQVDKDDLIAYKKHIDKVVMQERTKYSQRMNSLNEAVAKREAELYQSNVAFRALKDAGNAAQAQLTTAEAEVHRLDARINQLKKELEQTSNDSRHSKDPATLMAQNAVGDWFKKGAQQAGKALQTGAQQVGKAIEKSAQQTEQALQKGAEIASKWSELQALQAARATAILHLEAAKTLALSTEEGLEQFTDKKLFDLRVLQKSARADLDWAESKYIMKKGLIEGAIATYPKINKLTDFSVQHLVLSASAAGFFTKGQLPTFDCDYTYQKVPKKAHFSASVQELLSALLDAMLDELSKQSQKQISKIFKEQKK